MVGAHAVWVRAHPSACVYINHGVFGLGFCTGKRCGDCLVNRRRRSGGVESFWVVSSVGGGGSSSSAHLLKVLGVRVSKVGLEVPMGVGRQTRRCCVVFCGVGMVVAVFFTIFSIFV